MKRKPLAAGRIGGVDRLRGLGDAADQTLAQPHPGLVHGFGVQTLGGAEFQRFGVAEQIDRADLGAHRSRRSDA